MEDSVMRAMYIGITNCMSNSWEVLVSCINTITDDDFLNILTNFELSEECIRSAITIKAKIKNTNMIDQLTHISVIKLYADNGHDIDDGNSMIDLKKITNLLIKIIEKREKLDTLGVSLTNAIY
jgi:hypothetical protein